MSRSKRDILDTEKMLERLAALLAQHKPPAVREEHGDMPRAWHRADAEALRRISMTLHNWHEWECNADIQRFIPKRIDGKRVYIVAEESGFPYMVSHNGAEYRYTRLPDREAGAMKRLKKIMNRYPALTAYVQGDPRGCALYILRPGDVPKGESVDAYYSRGLAVFK